MATSPSPYQPLPGVSEEGVRLQQRVAEAFDKLAGKVLGAPVLATFMANGRATPGPVALAPIKNGAGVIIARALAGARVVTVVNPLAGTNLLASFEPTLTKLDQIQQTDTADLHLATLMFQVLA